MDWTLLGFKGLGQVVNVHPVFVHFPIALFPTALFLYFFGIITKKGSFIFSGRVCLYLAFLASIVAVVTGKIAANTVPHNEAIHKIILVHTQVGFGILFLGFALSLWSFLNRNNGLKFRWIFLALLAFAALAALQNGDLGGRMVFIEGAGVKPALPAMEPEHHHHHEDDDHPGHHE